MTVKKYVALDVDSANIVIGVYDGKGQQIMRGCIRTNGNDIRQFFKGLSGNVHVVFEEGTQAAWLYDLIRPLVAAVTVCNPRENKLLKTGNKNDDIDVDKLGKLLRLGNLKSVYHGEETIQGLKHLVGAYENLLSDTIRAMSRLKAMFRGRGIVSRGTKVYSNDGRDERLTKLNIEGLKVRAGYLYREIDCLMKLRMEAKKAMCEEATRHSAYKLIKGVPGIGPVRTAQIIATMGTPHRFRTKRQLWPYCGLAVVTRSSADYEWVGERIRKRKRPPQTRGLNKNYNRRLKQVFKGAALNAIRTNEQVKQYYQRLIDKGIRPEMAQLTVARKLSAITLAVWKKGEKFDPERLNQAAQSTGNQ
jgi:transposase